MADNPRIEELRRRVHADPASIAFAALAEEFRRVGRYDEAVETCRKGLLRHPAYLSARVTLGRALIETGDFAAAREQLQTVLRSAPENLVAIRALAEIEERLGHSTKMDPQLADAMNTHAESRRVALVASPLPPAAPAPGPSLAPQSASAAEPSSAPPATSSAAEPSNPMAPNAPTAFDGLGPSGGSPVDAPSAPPTDPFAAFAPRPSSAPAQDLSFDQALEAAFTGQPLPAVAAAPAPELTMAPPAEPVVEASPIALSDGSVELDLAIDVDPASASEPEPDLVLQMPTESGPRPEVVATLARLERFLGAIESLRA